MQSGTQGKYMGRTFNSLRNIKFNLIGQLANNVLKFVCRTVFIYCLGEEYLGISSLYTNILLLLSVSELGFSSAVTYSLYLPLAERNEDKICSIMRFYKKAYKIIGFVILGMGLCLIPFLPTLMNGTTDKVNIYVYYLLFLAQSVLSYFFFAYKQTLLLADQKKYLVDLVVYSVQVMTNVVQILILIFRRSFWEYTLVAVFSGVVSNLIISAIVDKRYPYLTRKTEKLSRIEVKKIFSQVYAMFLYRICNIVGVATDNLIISSNIGVLMVGLYDNYAMIVNVIQEILSSVLHAFTGSLGNLYVLESDKKNAFIFRCLNMVNLWFIIFASVSFLVLFQPFISLWIGESYTLDYMVVFIIVMNFATNHMQGVVQIFKDTTGLFRKGKYRPVATVVLNLGISLILVRTMGIAGVFLGSIISRMCTTWWYDAWLIHKDAFHEKPIAFYWECILSALIIVLLTGVIQGICMVTKLPVSWMGIIIRGILCVGIVNLFLFVKNRKKAEFAYLAEKVKQMLKNKLGR